MARKHDCQRDSNNHVVSIVWASDGSKRLVTTWGCNRCVNNWCTIYDPAKAEQERLKALRVRVQEIAREGLN